ncbi:14315_t:CDS:2, partial [Entrophospora sp. SA101]
QVDKKALEGDALVLSDHKQNFLLLERAVSTIESRYTTRVLRTTASIRKRLNADNLAQIIKDAYPKDSVDKSRLLGYLGNESGIMEVDVDDGVNCGSQGHIIPEVDLYLHLMMMIYLLDKKDFEKGIQLSNETLLKIQKLNRRTLDQLSAHIYLLIIQ